MIDYARKVARGEIEDPATLPILFEAPRDADWKDEALWHAVNPGLAYGYPDLEGLRQMAREAEHKPSERAIFQRYHLNIWQDHSSDPFVDMAIYDQGDEPFDLADLEHEPCWLAVDLSSNSDLTVIVAAWRDPDQDGGYIVHPWFFCPRDNLHRRAERDGVPYPLWAEEGFIEPTPGNVVDFRAVEDTIRDLCDRFTPAVQAILDQCKGHHDEYVFTYVCQRPLEGQKRGTRYPITPEGAKTQWRRFRARAKVENFRFHDIRHDVATKLLRKTGNLKLVQRALNHSDIKTTVKYAHVLDDEVAAALHEISSPTSFPTSEAKKAG